MWIVFLIVIAVVCIFAIFDFVIFTFTIVGVVGLFYFLNKSEAASQLVEFVVSVLVLIWGVAFIVKKGKYFRVKKFKIINGFREKDSPPEDEGERYLWANRLGKYSDDQEK